MRPPRRTRQVLRLLSPGKTKANARPVAILADPRARVLSGAHQRCTPETSDRMEQSVHAAAELTDARRRRQRMMAQPRVTKRQVDVVADLPGGCAGGETSAAKRPLLPRPRGRPEAGAVSGAAPGDMRNDLRGADRVARGLVVEAAVGIRGR
jgi:hypothetical protein